MTGRRTASPSIAIAKELRDRKASGRQSASPSSCAHSESHLLTRDSSAPDPESHRATAGRLHRGQPGASDEAEDSESLDRDFQYVFKKYYDSVLWFFERRGLNCDESQDLAQETFLNVFRGLSAFDRRSSYKTWIFQIAANTWKNALRRKSTNKRRAIEVSLDEDSGMQRASPRSDRTPEGASRADGPLDSVLEAESLELVRSAVNALPPRMRRCVQLRIYQQKKYQEIAGIMQLSIQTVKSQLHQARKRLRNQLRGYFADVDL